MSALKTLMNRLFAANQEKPGTLVLPEGDDPRVVEAAGKLLEKNVLKRLYLFGHHTSALAAYDDRIVYGNPSDLAPGTADHIRAMAAARGKVLAPEELGKLSLQPLDQAAYLLGSGKADAVVSGCVHTTADVIRAALRGVGLAKGMKTLSSCFAMVKDEQAMMFADCGVLVDPTVEQLVDIAEATVEMQRTLFAGVEPRVAFLSFSTKGSAEHEKAVKTREAQRLFALRCPSVASDGELQFDAAFDGKVGQRKAPGSLVAGKANVFVFPDLNAGNIAYKIAQRLGGFEAFGPLLQGTRKPFMDLSRGATGDDIVVASLIALLKARQ